MPTVKSPYPQFFDTDGGPLNNGYIYIGTAGLNPETNAIVVYWDEALTQPAAQPLRTKNGYIYRAGTPAEVFTAAEDYSITVRNNRNELVCNTLSLSATAYFIHAAPNKTPPVDADEFGIWNSVTGLLAKVNWFNIKAALATACAAGWTALNSTNCTNAVYASSGKNALITADTNLQTWADALPVVGKYKIALTVAQGNLPADSWYITLDRNNTDSEGLLYHKLRAEPITTANPNGTVYHNTCVNGVWSGWAIPASAANVTINAVVLGSIGYATGAGGTVTQATSKATAVSLNKICGTIYTHNAALAANTMVNFIFNNSFIGLDSDVGLTLNGTAVGGPSTLGAYLVTGQTFNGGIQIQIRNMTAGSLSEQVAINFSVKESAQS